MRPFGALVDFSAIAPSERAEQALRLSGNIAWVLKQRYPPDKGYRLVCEADWARELGQLGAHRCIVRRGFLWGYEVEIDARDALPQPATRRIGISGKEVEIDARDALSGQVHVRISYSPGLVHSAFVPIVAVIAGFLAAALAFVAWVIGPGPERINAAGLLCVGLIGGLVVGIPLWLFVNALPRVFGPSNESKAEDLQVIENDIRGLLNQHWAPP